MAELIAQGKQPQQRWRKRFPVGETVILGRQSGPWSVSWEPYLSRRHAELRWENGVLLVKKLQNARNPLYVNGQQANEFTMRTGEQFVIGETTFQIVSTPSSGAARPILEQRTIGGRELEQIPFRNAPHHLDVLSRLPELISNASDDAELYIRLTNMLLAGVRRADGVAIVSIASADGSDNSNEPAPVEVLYWDRRRSTSEEFYPSHRLVREAVEQGQTVMHGWKKDELSSELYTARADLDWAFCIPVPGEACKGWGIYIAGRFAGDAHATILAPWDQNDLSDDLKFTELVGSILGSLRQVQLLQSKQARLSPFFSPAVLRTLSDDPEKALEATNTEVTVLFCDMRGFSKKTEAEAKDLMPLLHRVSQALGVMTRCIFEQGGNIGDFQGDAAMAYWGWPSTPENKVELACRAALTIREVFESSAQKEGHPLAGFQVGIGIATGSAVAGRIGTDELPKLGVFGPVVNLASRLEGMTKLLRVPILLDETTAKQTAQIDPQIARTRRLLSVQPYGLKNALTVTELLPPESQSYLRDLDIQHYESALDAFNGGNWNKAYEELHQVTHQDRGKDFLTGVIIEHAHQPPSGWRGVVPLERKG